MSSIWNHGIKLSLWGESHSTAIGMVLDHLPAGKAIDMQQVQAFMSRRQAKAGGLTTARIEGDRPQIMAGLHAGTTNGTPLCLLIENQNVRSKDYEHLQGIPRPGHADYTGQLRYNNANDKRGGGHFSGRLTAPLVAAGAVCGQILAEYGVFAVAFLRSVQGIEDHPLLDFFKTKAEIEQIRALPFPMIDPHKRAQAVEAILAARTATDSVGGVVQCVAIGMPAGIGSPMFEGLENLIAQLIFGIPGVKGLEFGAGFEAARVCGSVNNDVFYQQDNSKNAPLSERASSVTVHTKTNNHGGILGGISSGMPIVFQVALKPTPSIAQVQTTLDLRTGEQTSLSVVGRHDPCIAVRAVPVVEACCNIALLGAIVAQNGLAYI